MPAPTDRDTLSGTVRFADRTTSSRTRARVEYGPEAVPPGSPAS
ncbi:hypothetical protein [Streptomyces sp. NPDC012756]